MPDVAPIPFDPTPTQRWREPVSANNHDLLVNMNSRLELLEDQFADLKAMLAAKFDENMKTMRWCAVIQAQAPISVTGILISTWLLYVAKLQTWEWMACCAVLVYPLYGDGIRVLMDRMRGKP